MVIDDIKNAHVKWYIFLTILIQLVVY
jgi:hypothetical protein